MKSVNILTITFAVLLAVALCSAAKPKTRFLVDDSKSQDTNELDDNTSEINTSEDTSENTSEDSDEKYGKRGKHIRGSDENEPECGYGQCHYFQESQMLEDIKSCDGCAEWFNSKFENEKDRHV
ncbi:unnamed protein product [Diamesa hyperborea]